MKTPEQKYNEALERAKKLQKTCDSTAVIGWCEYIFPELKKSEDERIRKELLNAFQESEDSLYMVLTPHRRESFIAWIEKQGKSTDRVENIHTFLYGEPTDEEMKQLLRTEYEKGKADAIAETQNPAWSEEDERMLKIIFDSLNTYAEKAHPCFKSVVKDEIEWLKLIKDRVQPQSKQEWSEEDKKKIDFLINLIRNQIRDVRHSFGYGDNVKYVTKEEAVDMLKSLKDRYTWKPSDEQVKVCKEVYADLLSAKGFDIGTVNSELNRLEEQLKKLKG